MTLLHGHNNAYSLVPLASDVVFVSAQLAAKPFNRLLKGLASQRRPEGSGKKTTSGVMIDTTDATEQWMDVGMPSYHAQSSFFQVRTLASAGL